MPEHNRLSLVSDLSISNVKFPGKVAAEECARVAVDQKGGELVVGFSGAGGGKQCWQGWELNDSHLPSAKPPSCFPSTSSLPPSPAHAPVGQSLPAFCAFSGFC